MQTLSGRQHNLTAVQTEGMERTEIGSEQSGNPEGTLILSGNEFITQEGCRQNDEREMIQIKTRPDW